MSVFKNGATVRCAQVLSVLGLAAISPALTACGGGGSSSQQLPAPLNIPDPTKATTITFSPATGQQLNFGFPANALSNPARVTVTGVAANALPLPITRAAHSSAAAATDHISRGFTPNAGNVYITAFKMAISPTTITQFNVPVSISGSKVVPSTIAANVTLNIAYLQNEGKPTAAWNDVGTFQTGPNGALTQNLLTTALPGVLQPGTYIIYQPAPGTTTSVANYGIALLADDSGVLQVMNLYDKTGTPLARPTLTGLQFANASDLDGQALTPDGSYGIMVDGGNTTRFFSGVQTGVPIASTNSVDISNYGGDGDAVAIMPNGNTAVVTGDSDQLLIITGITSGNPQPAATIACPGARDGLLISNDGKTLLARGPNGITVFAITPTPSATGPLGGTLAYAFTQVMDIPNLPSTGEDGRDGMAFSPADPSRAVVISADSNGPSITLITGLPNAPVLRASALHLPHASGVPTLTRAMKNKGHARRTRALLSGITSVYAVAVTPDGKSAIVGSDVGLAYVSGVNTGTLAQVGAVFNPTYSVTDSGGTAHTYNLGLITTLGITLDGKYVAAASSSPGDLGSLLMYPLTSGGFGAQVNQVDGIGIPGNDQILMH